ncbi:hypothetical protein [Rhodoplanes serenus]|uniref:hypothetical protein n=1 Tax=Rhodoplanes serenus TaxID=200615 RepID=UPI000DAC0BC0|nr:hypothetical protein [Rhodoplanes serenus]RAI34519.1 hypothetical protein CH340_08815 [Rhodoplanes serenus]
MAVTHDTALRSALADAVDARINTGSGSAKVRLRASTTTVVEFALANPAFGDAASGVVTLAGVPIEATATATGVVDNAQIIDRAGVAALACSVTAIGGGGDIEVSNVNIAVGQACTLESLTYAASV